MTGKILLIAKMLFAFFLIMLFFEMMDPARKDVILPLFSSMLTLTVVYLTLKAVKKYTEKWN